MKLNKYWFKVKNYGYGAYPCSLEGYMLVLTYILSLLASSVFIFSNPLFFVSLIIIESILLFFISKYKTEEKWKWRWGK